MRGKKHTAVSNQKPRDRYIPWLFVLFFMVIAVVDGVFVWIALDTHTGVTEDNAYQRGLAFNDQLEKAALAERLGWTGALEQEEKRVVFELKDANGLSVPVQSILVHLRRPAEVGFDFSLPMRRGIDGRYTIEPDWPLPGQWIGRVEAETAQGLYYLEERLFVQRETE